MAEAARNDSPDVVAVLSGRSNVDTIVHIVTGAVTTWLRCLRNPILVVENIALDDVNSFWPALGLAFFIYLACVVVSIVPSGHVPNLILDLPKAWQEGWGKFLSALLPDFTFWVDITMTMLIFPIWAVCLWLPARLLRGRALFGTNMLVGVYTLAFWPLISALDIAVWMRPRLQAFACDQPVNLDSGDLVFGGIVLALLVAFVWNWMKTVVPVVAYVDNMGKIRSTLVVLIAIPSFLVVVKFSVVDVLLGRLPSTSPCRKVESVSLSTP
jgi:hypothetical protein